MQKENLSLEEVLSVLQKRKKAFEERFGVTSIGVFGSLVRGERKSNSDVDIVVKMKKPDLFHMVHIKEELEADYQAPVDIIHYREKMNEFLKKRIDIEAVYV